MKKIKIFAIASLLSAMPLLWVACVNSTSEKGTPNEENSKPLIERVENFEVKSEDTVEIGQYYTPELPQVTVDGEHAFVTLEVAQGDEKLFLNGDNALLVESFEDITLTYTVEEGSQRLSKNTILKVVDTAKPYIVVKSLPETLYCGATFRYDDYIRIGDLSGVLSQNEITLTDQDGNPVAGGTDSLTLPENSTVQEVTFSISATDTKNNSNEKSFTLPVAPARILGASVLETVTSDTVQAYGVGTSNVQVLTDSATGKQVIEFKADTGGAATDRGGNSDAKGTKYGVLIDCPDWIEEFKDTAYVNVTFEIMENTTTKRGWCAMDLALYDGMTASTTAMTTANATQTFPVNVSKILQDGKLAITVANSAAHANGTMGIIRITDIEFCFSKVLYSNSTAKDNVGVNLLEKTGLLENEILEITFDGKAITDLTAFKPTKNGELLIKIQKDGYLRDYVAKVEVVVYDAIEYTSGSGEVINFNEFLDIYHSYYKLSYKTVNGAAISITDKNEKRNQQPTENGTYIVQVAGDVTGGLKEGTTIYIDVTVN